MTDDIMALADAVFKPPVPRRVEGEEPTPGSAAAISSVARESTEGDSSARSAGASSGRAEGSGREEGRAGIDTPGAATFALPDTRVPLTFPTAGDKPRPSMPPGVPPPPPPKPPGVPPPFQVGTAHPYDALRWS